IDRCRIGSSALRQSRPVAPSPTPTPPKLFLADRQEGSASVDHASIEREDSRPLFAVIAKLALVEVKDAALVVVAHAPRPHKRAVRPFLLELVLNNARQCRQLLSAHHSLSLVGRDEHLPPWRACVQAILSSCASACQPFQAPET